MLLRTFVLAASTFFALAFASGCSGSSDDKGGGGGSSGGSSSGSSSGSSCSSESTSKQAYLCIGGRCKCASSGENKYPYTEDEAKQACSSGTSTGNCPPSSSSGGSSSGGSSSGGSSSGGSSSGGSSSGGDPDDDFPADGDADE